jgi:hypothetical protein
MKIQQAVYHWYYVTDGQTDAMTQSAHKASLSDFVKNAYQVQKRDDAHVKRPHLAT